MHQLRYEGKSRVSIVEVSNPEPGPGEVVVKTAFSAICGSELHVFRGAGSPTGNNGHEAVGTIVRVGKGVTNLHVGQRVGASCVVGCGTCPACQQAQYTWCPQFKFYGSMHAEKFLAAASACYPLPEDVPWKAGVLLTGDGLGVPYHTSKKIASPDIRTVAVFGVGPIGLGNVMMQSHLGRKVIAIDPSATRVDLARSLGARHGINAPGQDVVEQIRALTGGVGPDVCIEAAGEPETALACFAAVRTAGIVVFNGEQDAVPLSPSAHFIRRDITAIGSWFYHFAEIPAMVALYRQGLPVEKLITHTYAFADAAEAYATFSARETGKVLLAYES